MKPHSRSIWRSRGRPRTSDRLLVEDCAGVLTTESLLQPEPGALGSVTVTVTLPSGLQRKFLIRIATTRMPTGGLRPWFVCPVCGGRRARLYLPTGNEHDYACRTCLGAAYHVQYRKGWLQDMVRSFWKSERRNQVLREREQFKRHTEDLAALEPRIEALLEKTAPKAAR